MENANPSPSAVTQACNPSYLGNGLQEDHGSKSHKQKICKTPISTNCWAWWHAFVIPAIWESTNRKITVQGIK
jgi:hypothetical protein